MKKLIFLLVAVILMLSLLATPCFAEEGAENTETVTENTQIPEETAPEMNSEPLENEAVTPETLEDFAQSEEEGFLDQFTTIITNGEIWAKIGATVLGILALIIAINKNLDKIIGALDAVKNMVAGKATKEETKKTIEAAMSDVKTTYEAKHKEITEKYDALEKKYDQQTAILTLLSLQLVKSPNARVRIMELISETKELGGDIAEIVENIEAEIEAADAAEPAPDTPALDAVALEINSRSGGDTSYIALE